MAILLLHLDRQTAAALAQVVATVLAAVGIVTSLYIGIRTLQEVQSDRLHRVRPKLLFDQGARGVECDLEERIGIPGIDPGYAAEFLKGRSPHAKSCVAQGLWGDLTNPAVGPLSMRVLRFLRARFGRRGRSSHWTPKSSLSFHIHQSLTTSPPTRRT